MGGCVGRGRDKTRLEDGEGEQSWAHLFLSWNSSLAFDFQHHQLVVRKLRLAFSSHLVQSGLLEK